MSAVKEWECGSCGAFTDAEIADDGDLYHDPDEDCRAIRVLHKAKHEDHERFIDGCAECEAAFEREAAYHGALYRAGAQHRESIALAREEIGSDRTGDLDADEMAAIQRQLK